MGKALDLVSFAVTAPGATLTAMAAVTGDSANIRNALAGTNVGLVGMWTKSQAVGVTQVTFPSGHDVTRGFRYRNIANQPGNMIPRGIMQVMRPQDPLTVQETGSAVAGDVELAHLLVAYDDLPGVNGRFIGPDEVSRRMVNLLTVEDTTTAAAASVYSGARALNAASDLLRADTDYALLGAKIGATCGALTVRGVDTGNLRVGIPGLTSVDVETANWFLQLSEWTGQPWVPIFNSANKTGIFIENVQDENLTAVPFSLILAQLSPA